jgi:thiosulfate dehydrogenase
MNELHSISKAIALIFCLVLLLAFVTLLMRHRPELFHPSADSGASEVAVIKLWQAPDTATIPLDEQGKLIRYGRDLISRTSKYLGPHGSVKSISNGMNCQNCHLEGGTKPFGNNYGSVASLYPKFRPRSATKESIERRVNDCFERSLNGQAIDSSSREMRAIVSYIKWLGKDVPIGKPAPGAGLAELEWLSRAADPAKGRKGYLQKCQVCHGPSGAGQRLTADGPFIYPPLWGDNSFTTGAGLFRVSNFARYIRTNMPNGATYQKPILTDEEAWDIAAYVESLPRPVKIFQQDWPKIELKPVDHPFGPYADKFSEQQHKYGPFKEIIAATKK